MEYWAPSLTVEDELEKLVIRMNPPRFSCRPLSSILVVSFPNFSVLTVLFTLLELVFRVTVDNATSKRATLIKVTPLDDLQKPCLIANARIYRDCDSGNLLSSFQVDSANKRGSLLEVVQVLTDINLIIRRAYISSDGEWLMDGESL